MSERHIADTGRPWDDERGASDAPVWFGADEAGAWAQGYNSAVQAYVESLNAARAAEQFDGNVCA